MYGVSRFLNRQGFELMSSSRHAANLDIKVCRVGSVWDLTHSVVTL